jgi:hypothetical protein
LGSNKLAPYKIANLTGTETTELTVAQKAELKAFIDSGGTLIVDAAGGQAAFASSIELQLPQLGGGALKPLPIDHELYRAGGDIKSVGYRSFARMRLPAGCKDPNLQAIDRDGRVAVIYSREDLTAGLVGQSVDGVDGYSPASATALMRSVLLFVGRQ